MHYGKDYYKFKSFLLLISIFGILTATIYTSLSTSKIICPTFFENLPDWVSYIFWGFGGLGILCGLIVRLADLDEIFNE